MLTHELSTPQKTWRIEHRRGVARRDAFAEVQIEGETYGGLPRPREVPIQSAAWLAGTEANSGAVSPSRCSNKSVNQPHRLRGVFPNGQDVSFIQALPAINSPTQSSRHHTPPKLAAAFPVIIVSPRKLSRQVSEKADSDSGGSIYVSPKRKLFDVPHSVNVGANSPPLLASSRSQTLHRNTLWSPSSSTCTSPRNPGQVHSPSISPKAPRKSSAVHLRGPNAFFARENFQTETNENSSDWGLAARCPEEKDVLATVMRA